MISLTKFLTGGEDPDNIDVDPVFETPFEVAMDDFLVDAGANSGTGAVSLDPAPWPRLLTMNGIDFREALSMDGLLLGVAACHLAPDNASSHGRASEGIIGLYTGCTLAVHPDFRRRSIGTILVMLRFLLEEELPLWHHDKPAYSPAGIRVHIRAHEHLKRLAGRRKRSDYDTKRRSR